MNAVDLRHGAGRRPARRPPTTTLSAPSRPRSPAPWPVPRRVVCATCTPSRRNAGSRVSTMVSRPGSGLPMDWNVLRPMISGRPSVSARKWRRSVFSRQISWLSRPITPFSAAATTMTMGKRHGGSPRLVGQPPQRGVGHAAGGPAVEQLRALRACRNRWTARSSRAPTIPAARDSRPRSAGRGWQAAPCRDRARADCGSHEQVFQVNAVAAPKGGEVVEPQREARRSRPCHSAMSQKTARALAEQRLAQHLGRGVDVRGQALICGRVRGRARRRRPRRRAGGTDVRRHARCSGGPVQAMRTNRHRRPDGRIGIVAFDHDVVEAEVEERSSRPD